VDDRLYPFSPKKFVTKSGHTLSYLDEGQGPVVVMVHGNPTWSFYYRNLTALLKKNFRVIVPDHLGCGLSDKPQDYPYRLHDHIENLEDLLADLQVKETSLVVHDWGGAIGLGYGGRHPKAITSLVILNTAAFPSSKIPLRISLCRIPILGELLVRGLNGFAWPATFMAVSKPMSPEVKKGFLAPYGNWHDRIATHRFVKDIPMEQSHISWSTLVQVEEGLAHFKDTPMFILWGGKDFCFNDYYFNQWRKRFPKAAYKYFDDAGHYLLEDKHGEIEPLIAEFLKRS